MKKIWTSIVSAENWYWTRSAIGFEDAFHNGCRMTRLEVNLEAFETILSELIYALFCHFRGHNYMPDGHDFIESGGEGFSCTRCGHGFTAWH